MSLLSHMRPIIQAFAPFLSMPKEISAEFVDFSDMANVRLCLTHSKKADLMLRVNDNGEIIPLI